MFPCRRAKLMWLGYPNNPTAAVATAAFFADVVEFGLEDINKIYEQGLILEKVPPEVAAYPASLRGSYWAANNLIFFVGAWNTAQVKKDAAEHHEHAFAVRVRNAHAEDGSINLTFLDLLTDLCG